MFQQKEKPNLYRLWKPSIKKLSVKKINIQKEWMKWDQTSDDNLAVIGAEGSIQKLPLHCSALIALEGQGGKCWRDLCPAGLFFQEVSQPWEMLHSVFSPQLGLKIDPLSTPRSYCSV